MTDSHDILAQTYWHDMMTYIYIHGQGGGEGGGKGGNVGWDVNS